MHLFFLCPVMRSIWDVCYSWIDTTTVLPREAQSCLLQHVVPNGLRRMKEAWRTVWCSIVWNIWTCRNNCIFKGGSFELSTLLENISFWSWSWMKGSNKGFSYSYVQWTSNIKTCIANLKWFVTSLDAIKETNHSWYSMGDFF